VALVALLLEIKAPMVVIVILDHLMRWVVAGVADIAETIRAIVADQVADQDMMRHRQHLVQAPQDREITVAVVAQTQIHTQAAAVAELAVRA
jgi:hypothetical protein